MMRKLLILLMILSPTMVAEQKIYRTENEACLVSFSDRLPLIDPDNADEVKAEEVVIDSKGMNTLPSSFYSEAIKQNEREQQANARDKVKQERAVDEKIAKTIIALQQAEQELEAGQVRNARDLLAKSGGGTRLAPAYLDRVSTLIANRDAAQVKLEKLYRQKSKF
jgi:hypothetical protein